MKNNIYLIYLMLIISIFPIIIYSNWGITDDYHIITLNYRHLSNFYQDVINVGRFPPINWIGIFLVRSCSSYPVYQYILNFICACIAFSFLILLMKKIFLNKLQFVLLLIALSPAFVECFFRLAPIEKQLFVLISIFVYYFYRFLEKNQAKYLILSLTIAFISIFYKEPVFLLYLGLGFIYYLESRYLLKEENFDVYTKLRPKFILIFVVISSLIFLTSYKIITYNASLNYNNFFASSDLSARIYQTFRIIIRYIFSNPFVLIGVPFSIFIRIIHRKGINEHFKVLDRKKYLPFYDGLLAGGLLYTSAILFLGLYGDRYLLPVMGFCFLPVLFYVSYAFKYKLSKLAKTTLSIILIILFLNSSIMGTKSAIALKVGPYQFQKMISALVKELEEDISDLRDNEKVDIYLPGRNRGGNVENYASIGKYLVYNEIPENKFDFKSMEEVKSRIIYDYYKGQLKQYSIYKTEDIFYPKVGDYLVLYNKYEKLPEKYGLYLEKNDLQLNQIYPEQFKYIYILNPPVKPLVKRILIALGYPFKSKTGNIQFIEKINITWAIFKVIK